MRLWRSLKEGDKFNWGRGFLEKPRPQLNLWNILIVRILLSAGGSMIPYQVKEKYDAKIPFEWALELLTAVVLFVMIQLSVHTGALPSDAVTLNGNDRSGHEEITGEDNGISGAEKNVSPEKEHYIENFDIVLQTPELPTGCEITAMTMVLNYYGFDIDKVTMASDYLPTAPAKFYRDSDGEMCGPDLERYFVGNPAEEEGYVCGTKAILTAANGYLRKTGSALRAFDGKGVSPGELYHWVSEDTPVVVWVTIHMDERVIAGKWKTESGEFVEWGHKDHGAVLIGYTEDTVTIADPISGEVVYEKEAFERVYASRGSQCVILKK